MRSFCLLILDVFFYAMMLLFPVFFFFSSRRRHTRSDRDWSSDVCSSDLLLALDAAADRRAAQAELLHAVLELAHGEIRVLQRDAREGDKTLAVVGADLGELRSEERRVGKECRSRWSPYH